MNRRHFLQTGSAAALALSGIHRYAEAFADTPLRAGVIGTGWYGKCNLFRLLQVAPQTEVVSLCDVDSAMLAEAAARVAARQASKKTPRTYKDYREMLAEQDLDVVIVATPDHWHALPAIAAMKAGADVYVEKPISVDVVEGQAMVATARKHGRVVQVNTQRRSTPHLMEARDEIIRTGKLGRVGRVETYSHNTVRRDKNLPSVEPPPELDYEFWTGPAPMKPFTPLTHPMGWRAFMEYGNGTIGDIGVHMFDMVRWLLELGPPKRISSAGHTHIQPGATINIPDTQVATFDYGDLQVTWNHRYWGTEVDRKYRWGATLYGEKGTLQASVWAYKFTPVDGEAYERDVVLELDEYPEDRTEERLEHFAAPAIRRHFQNFLECRETRERPVADIEQGHISSASCILGNVAMNVGRTLEWDFQKGVIVGDEEATALLRRPYRTPWVHPEPA
jgi:predicted dehydrogenase